MSEGKIIFVGAGPGAPDLLTLRGARVLKTAGVVIYAGSLVDERLLELCPRATLHNSAQMSLEQVVAVMEQGWRTGQTVVRLHTGDPGIYGATAEQYRALESRGIPYEIVPGVSSVFAAAASLRTELTVPDVAMSVVLTRMPGRTPVPEGEDLGRLASGGATLCLFLSAGAMPALAEKLRSAGRPVDTPVALVYRASWENERIVRGTLADIAEKVAEAGIRRQAMVIVGEVLKQGKVSPSRLYSADFATGYRHLKDGFTGRCALFGLTRAALLKAAEIAPGLSDAVIFTPEKHAEAVPALRRQTYPDGQFAEAFARAWHEYSGLVMVMATGIVTRLIARLAEDKAHDPAVVVCDEAARYAVPLLSGHVGGANRLAVAVARITGGQAVLTTASDVRQLPALDEWAARRHYWILNPSELTSFASAVLAGETVELDMPQAIFDQDFGDCPQFHLVRDCQKTGEVEARTPSVGLKLRKQRLWLGVGCRRGVSGAALIADATRLLGEHGYSLDEMAGVATAELKRDELGIRELGEHCGCPVQYFTAAELNAVPVPHPSPVATQRLGVNSVSEASALLAAGAGATLVVEKVKSTQATFAVAREDTP
ncbi:MAG: precorrin-4 C(11)-methyltransferase [Victivallales bacterium]|nr:precorrin-4 C(11)-methyltransferase [Victivallales bacterium]